MHLPYDWAIPFLGICQREMKTYIHTKTCTQMFMLALIIIATHWKQTNVHNQENG